MSNTNNTNNTPKVFVEYKDSEWHREYDYFHRRHKAWFQGTKTKRVEFKSVQEAFDYINESVKKQSHSKPAEKYRINTERAYMKYVPNVISDYRIAFES